MSASDELRAAVERLEEVAAGLAAAGVGSQDMADLAAEAVRVSAEITRLLPPVLEGA